MHRELRAVLIAARVVGFTICPKGVEAPRIRVAVISRRHPSPFRGRVRVPRPKAKICASEFQSESLQLNRHSILLRGVHISGKMTSLVLGGAQRLRLRMCAIVHHQRELRTAAEAEFLHL